MYRNNLAQMIITPQLQNLLSSNNNNNNGNNNNDNGNNNNNNGNNNNNNGNNNSPGGNDNNVVGNDAGGVNNDNPPVTSSNSFGGSGQFEVSVANSGSPAGMDTNINCAFSQNGNNIQIGLDLTPTECSQRSSDPYSTQITITLFNFAGTTSQLIFWHSDIRRTLKGGLNPGSHI